MTIYPQLEVDEHSVPGLQIGWFHERQIVAYKLTQASNAVFEAWSEAVINIMAKWPQEQPYLALHNLSVQRIGLGYAVKVGFDVGNLGVLPQYRERAEATLNERDIFYGRVAVTFNASSSGNLGNVASGLRGAKNKSTSIIQYRSFFETEIALDWLLEGRDHQAPSDLAQDTPKPTEDKTPSLTSTMITKGLYETWHADKKLVEYRVEDVTPDLLKSWGAVARQNIRAWPPDRPYLALHDISTSGVATKYAVFMKKILNLAVTEEDYNEIAEVIAPETGFTARVALVVSSNFSGNLAAKLASAQSAHNTESHIAYRVFSQREVALDWLRAT